jgi:UDP-3-O-[3-hydroxymyristoyl] glucosamine N-acyltransferase
VLVAYIGPDVKIGANAIPYPNVTILDASTVGTNTLYGLVALLESVVILGNDCIIHPMRLLVQTALV